MSAARVIAAGRGEVVGDAPDRRVEILCEHEALHATWARFGPRREGADLHVHRDHTDFFYVLEGELTVMLGPAGDPVPVPAGTLAWVPPHVVHGFRNGTDAEVRYLNLHAPGVGFVDYMRAMRDGRSVAFDQHPPPPDGGRPPSEAVIGGARTGDAGVKVLADLDAIRITEVALAAGGDPPVAPAGDGRDEFLYVLDGELTVAGGEGGVFAGPGAWVQLPAGAPREPSGPEPVRYLQLHPSAARARTGAGRP